MAYDRNLEQLFSLKKVQKVRKSNYGSHPVQLNDKLGSCVKMVTKGFEKKDTTDFKSIALSYQNPRFFTRPM
jgi:hypothetical protein